MQEQEEKRENQLKNNKKLPQFSPSEDPVLNDFKRETMFYRLAQATVLEALPKLKEMGIPTIRWDVYFNLLFILIYIYNVDLMIISLKWLRLTHICKKLEKN